MPVGRPLAIWLRIEGAAIFVAASAYFWVAGGSLWTYALLFFLPDVSFLGYLAGARVGAAVYNAAHTSTCPLALAVASWLISHGGDGAGAAPGAAAMGGPLLAAIWLAHIGFDRGLGYGLKYPTAFQHTHLGRIGRR